MLVWAGHPYFAYLARDRSASSTCGLNHWSSEFASWFRNLLKFSHPKFFSSFLNLLHHEPQICSYLGVAVCCLGVKMKTSSEEIKNNYMPLDLEAGHEGGRMIMNWLNFLFINGPSRKRIGAKRNQREER